MQVTTSLFATIFALLALVAPFGTYAMQITTSAHLSTGNATIQCIPEVNDPTFLTFFLVNNNTAPVRLAENVASPTGAMTVFLPANATGDGWRILATSPTSSTPIIGASLPFTIAATVPVSKGSGPRGPAIIAAVAGGLIFFSLLVFALFYVRRRRQQHATGPVFNLEHAFPPEHTRSFSVASSRLEDTGKGTAIDIEQEKMQWEMQLEAQFARARAETPDVRRGATPTSRAPSASPPRMLQPQRAARRNGSF
ncbi:hypothetical protein C8R46DRAFT_1213038 [Mycena filopes]|nr:hypothetical protein C8R46DRAFT_1213038 [Mycena filopes]